MLKKIIIGIFSSLMLFGGMFAHSQISVQASVARCMTGGPVNTVTLRVSQRTTAIFYADTNSDVVLFAGTHVTHRSGDVQTRNFDGVRHQRVIFGGHYVWVRQSHLASVNTC
ncbi:MAG: hypothetical protein FWE07_02910 [Turicibacter sp.]|nr:hypothetical protein [Turicibacter sp.]